MPASPTDHPPANRVTAVLAVGILAVSTAGTLVRLLPETHPLVVAFWRVLLVTVVLLPGLQRVSARNVVLSCVGGLFLALHFWTWFASLHLTSVMRSTLLVCLTPIWAGLIEWIILRSPPARHFWAGIGIALVGVAVMVVPGVDGGASSMLGDGLAVLGGILGAAYFTMGRVVRATVAIRSYGPLSCGATAMWLAMLAFATDVPIFSVEGAAWWPILGLAFGPQLLGHVGFNYAVGRLPAATVAGVILLEPVGATAVAAFALGEIPSTFSLLGGLITLIGVAFAVLPRGLARQPRLGGA